MQNRIVHDEELILRLQRGDDWVFQLLVRRFRETIFTIAFGITLDAHASREITQEVFLEVHRRADGFKGQVPLPNRLQRITVKRCLAWKRRWIRRFQWLRSGTVHPRATGSAADSAVSQNPLNDRPSHQWIDNALKRLTDHQRTVWVLYALAGLSHEGIAYATGLPEATVKAKLSQALQRITGSLPPLVGANR